MKKIITVLMAMVLSLSLISFGGCSEEEEDKIGTFHALDEAYRMQLLTRRDIMLVSYRYCGAVYLTPEEDGMGGECHRDSWVRIDFQPGPLESLVPLDKETELNIKRAFFRNYRDDLGYFDPDEEEDAAIADLTMNYYGNFDGKYVVNFGVGFGAMLTAVSVAGISWVLSNTGPEFLVFMFNEAE